METTSTFLGSWDQYMFFGAVAFIVIGALILLYHEFKVLQIKGLQREV